MAMLKQLLMFILSGLILNSLSQAETIRADYNVSYGVFGQIGTAKASLHKTKKNYKIDIHLESTGLAKILSSGRTERHISKGRIVEGRMVSDLYQVKRSYGDRVASKEYYIEHKKRKVRKKYTKYQAGKLVKEKNSYLDYYAKDDLLTLYFNLDGIIKDKHRPDLYHLKAVGAEKQKGKVSLTIPHKEELGTYYEELGSDSAWYATVIIHQKIFSSREGRLLLSVAKDGIADQALLKDVILFGDIKGIRVK